MFIASTLSPGWAIESIGFLLSSMLHLSGAFPSIGKVASNSFLKYRLTLAYASITVAAAILSYASFSGLAPAFFGVGGSTLLDQSFTLLSIILFSASSIFFFIKAQKRAKPLFQYWYSVGLAIFAVTSFLRCGECRA